MISGVLETGSGLIKRGVAKRLTNLHFSRLYDSVLIFSGGEMSENQQQELSNVNFDVKKEGGPNKTWIFVRDHIGLPNAFYNFPIAVSAIGSGAIDIIGRHSEYLLAGAVATGIGSVILYLGKKNKQSTEQIKKRLRLCLTAFGFTSVAACASYAMGSPNGVVAHFVPVVKTWQDKYLVDIKQDTDIIKKQNDETNAKLDKVNAMLAQLLVNRPELEKPLVEQIKGFKSLPDHQQNALLLFTSKVGTNGVVRYKGLIKAVNTYAENQTAENAKAVTQHINYIVRVNGKDIEDTKTKNLIISLFLDPATFDYLVGVGALPQDQSLLTQLGVDLSKPTGEQLADPLGDFIKQLTAEGKPIAQQVVIPSSENFPQAQAEVTMQNPAPQTQHHKSKRGVGHHGVGQGINMM